MIVRLCDIAYPSDFASTNREAVGSLVFPKTAAEGPPAAPSAAPLRMLLGVGLSILWLASALSALSPSK